jgi:hypothetical protein
MLFPIHLTIGIVKYMGISIFTKKRIIMNLRKYLTKLKL